MANEDTGTAALIFQCGGPYFVGRETEIKEIQLYIGQEKKSILISGMGELEKQISAEKYLRIILINMQAERKYRMSILAT